MSLAPPLSESDRQLLTDISLRYWWFRWDSDIGKFICERCFPAYRTRGVLSLNAVSARRHFQTDTHQETRIPGDDGKDHFCAQQADIQDATREWARGEAYRERRAEHARLGRAFKRQERFERADAPVITVIDRSEPERMPPKSGKSAKASASSSRAPPANPPPAVTRSGTTARRCAPVPGMRGGVGELVQGLFSMSAGGCGDWPWSFLVSFYPSIF